MAAVVGYLVVASIAIAVTLAVAGPRLVVRPDPTLEVRDVAARHVTVLGALAGFAVTGVVFLVTQSRTLDNPAADTFTTALAMFLVAYMGYWSSSVLYANVSHQADEPVRFDLAAAQYAGASITLFSLYLGWFALKPLFDAFGLDRVASIASWLLGGGIVVAFGFMGTALVRSGYASARQVALLGALAVVGTLAYAIVAGAIAPGLRAPGSALQLTIAAFAGGLPAYAAFSLLPVLARSPRLVPVLADRWHLVLLGYAQAVTVLVGFLLLAVLGLA
jgi:hypothetical protein